jgi:signal peptidase I
MARKAPLALLLAGGGVVVVALLAAARTEWQSFDIRSGAMAPTLVAGDYVFARHYRAVEPQRGDVAVFRFRDQNYVKRLIGLPGDTIHCATACSM